MTPTEQDDELREAILLEFKNVHRLAPADYTENCTNVVMQLIQAHIDQQVRKMLEELKQCKNVAGEPLVNLGTEVWIDDRIAGLTKKPTYSELRAEKTEALRPIAKEIVDGLTKGEQE